MAKSRQASDIPDEEKLKTRHLRHGSDSEKSANCVKGIRTPSSEKLRRVAKWKLQITRYSRRGRAILRTEPRVSRVMRKRFVLKQKIATPSLPLSGQFSARPNLLRENAAKGMPKLATQRGGGEAVENRVGGPGNCAGANFHAATATRSASTGGADCGKQPRLVMIVACLWDG